MKEVLECTFPAMGNTVTVGVVAVSGLDTQLLRRARQRIDEYETMWSRFLPGTDVSAINRNAGEWTAVRPQTARLIRLARASRELTGGRFDPLLGGELIGWGYDRSFELMPETSTVSSRVAPSFWPKGTVHAWPRRDPANGGDVEIDSKNTRVRIPVGTQLDLGGIAKGYAADLVLEELLEQGARGASVQIGGDVRVGGVPPDGDAWTVKVERPAELGRDAGTDDTDCPEFLRIAEGAVAMTSSYNRQWNTSNGPAHHLFDPSTRAPLAFDVPLVVVVGAAGWWTEALTKAFAVCGPTITRDEIASIGPGVEAFVYTERGAKVCSRSWDVFAAVATTLMI